MIFLEHRAAMTQVTHATEVGDGLNGFGEKEIPLLVFRALLREAFWLCRSDITGLVRVGLDVLLDDRS